MSTRESRRLKEKRSIIPFGDIMLPVIGLAAVGLLIVGVKLFFLSGPKIPEYKPMIYANAQTKVPEALPPVKGAVTVAESPPAASPPSAGKTVLAAPVGSKGAGASQTATTVTAKTSPVAAPPSAASQKTKASPQPTPKPASTPANSKWGVQIGSFGAKNSAETVKQQAAKAGYTAVVTSAVVNGKTYFRVTVPAGNDRNSANNLAKNLEKAGFPVFVVGLR